LPPYMVFCASKTQEVAFESVTSVLIAYIELEEGMERQQGCPVPPNVRANRTPAAGWLGPGWENVPRTPDRAKTARRWGSGGSARG
jgi:hypothetical protein